MPGVAAGPKFTRVIELRGRNLSSEALIEIDLEKVQHGGPRIGSSSLKLGIDVGQTSVARYMARRRGPPSQGWKTFCAIMLMASPRWTCSWCQRSRFRLLYGLLILQHDRRHILWMAATAHPTAERIARQLVEACGWKQAPRYIVRDRDRVYGKIFVRRVRAMGIQDRPVSPRSPW